MPLLSPTSTLLCSSAFTTAYLGSIYLLPSTRVSLAQPLPPPGEPQDIASTVPAGAPERRDRNHPAVIKARLLAVSLASAASCAALPAILQHAAPTSYPSYRAAVPAAVQLLGLALPSSSTRWADLARLVAYPLGLTASLFAGSVHIHAIEGELPGQVRARSWASWAARFGGWRGVRNYVLVRSPSSTYCVSLHRIFSLTLSCTRRPR